MLKVLHLISSSGFFGAESIVLTLGKNIRDAGFQSVIGALEDGRHNGNIELVERAGKEGIETRTFKCNGRFDVGAIFRVKNYLVRERVSLLHTHNYKSDIIGAMAARLAGVPAVATAHGFTDMDASVSFYEKLDRMFLKRFFRRVVVVTEKMLPDLRPEIKRVIPNGIDADGLKSDQEKRVTFRSKYSVDAGDILVGTVGRLSKEKNQKMFLQAIEPVLQRDRRVKAVIVGSGPEERNLRDFARSRQIAERVIFTGNVEDMVSVYSSLDIFVISSVTEGVPLTVLEAMAFGLPVIATRVGGIPQVIEEGRSGILIDARDTEALRKTIDGLIHEPSQGQRLGETAQSIIRKNHSLERMCSGYRKVYGEVLA